MGWGRMLLLGHLDQLPDIHGTRTALEQIDERLRQSARCDEKTFRDRCGLSRESLTRQVNQVDGRCSGSRVT